MICDTNDKSVRVVLSTGVAAALVAFRMHLPDDSSLFKAHMRNVFFCGEATIDI